MKSASGLLMLILLIHTGPVYAETIGDVIYTGDPLPVAGAVNGSIEKARAAYADFLAGAADSPHRATAIRRLADLELEVTLLALEDGSKASFDRPIELYRSFLQEYPTDPARDHVLYQISRALDNSGQAKEALTYLQELTSKFSDSVLAAEALFRQGELMFVARDYGGAAQAYEAVYSKHSDTRFETNARYKHGWSLFKTDHYAESLSEFAGLIDFVLEESAPVPEQLRQFTPGQREMFEDALHATSIALAELGGAAHLGVLLNSEPIPEWSYLLYERLGEHYLSEERFAESAESFGAFARRMSSHAQAPILQARVIETYEAAGFGEKAIQARGDFVHAYGFDALFWNGRLPADYPDITTQIDRHLKSLTEHYHALAQSTAEDVAVDAAVEWYRAWLDYFPDEPQTAGRNFLLSELLFDANRFGEAAMEYERTAYDYPGHEGDSEAGYAALLARDKAYAAALDTGEAAILRQLALDSKLRFADRWPRDPRAAAVLLTAAEELLALGQLDDAILVSERVLQYVDVLAQSQQRTAWIVQAHAQFDLEHFAKAEPAYRQALEKTTNNDKLKAGLQDRLAASIYQLGRLAREFGDDAKAARHFLRVSELSFNSTVHPVALYDASAALIKLEHWNKAASVLENFRRRYADHELADGIAEQLTAVYLQGNRPLDAAAELASIASTADGQTATAARWQAAQLYADNDERVGQLQMLKTIARSKQTPVEEAMQAREQLVTAYESDSDAAAVRYWQEQIIAADAATGVNRSDYSRTLAARSALALAEPSKAAFELMTLTLPLDRSLPAKKAAMETAMAAFQQVADYAIAETSSAATFQIADLYRKFGRALMDSERPPELDELALEEYELLLEEQAFPFEEKAIEVHEINTTRAASLVYDEWIARSYTQLAQLLPARYNKEEQHESIVMLLD